VRHSSEGTLVYSIEHTVGHKLVLVIDPGIAETYRALIPKVVRLNRPKFAPHISVIRKEPVPKVERWGKHDGERVAFEYEPVIYNDETYYWLRCYSPRLIEVRRELGLEYLSELARPPDLADCFHTTIANTKAV
jgi:hypothetical protein